MYILFQPKQPVGFNYDNTKISYTGGRVNCPAGVLWTANVDKYDIDVLAEMEYCEITEEEATRSWKFYGNVSGYINVVEGREAELGTATSREPNLVKVKYYLTEQDTAAGISFMRKALKFGLEVRAKQRIAELATLDEIEVAKFPESSIISTLTSVTSELNSAVTMEDLCVIAHNKFGYQAPRVVVDAFNLSTPTSVL